MMQISYKVVDLFGNEEINFLENQRKVSSQAKIDYEGFVEKFEIKRTTDDCYTPSAVYNVIIEYLNSKSTLVSKIIRPFYPGGDYESIDYSDAVVVDNPPFSIITKIARFYIERNIKFFLFAPHMTLFTSDLDCTALVVGADIIYENGAIIKTSFLTNMLGDFVVIGDPNLYNMLSNISKKNKAELPKYEYPANVLTVSKVQSLVSRGIHFTVHKGHASHCKGLDDQKKIKKGIFGGGFLLSDKAAADKAAAENAAAEAAEIENSKKFFWKLSNREKQIIEKLNSGEI